MVKTDAQLTVGAEFNINTYNEWMLVLEKIFAKGEH